MCLTLFFVLRFCARLHTLCTHKGHHTICTHKGHHTLCTHKGHLHPLPDTPAACPWKNTADPPTTLPPQTLTCIPTTLYAPSSYSVICTLLLQRYMHPPPTALYAPASYNVVCTLLLQGYMHSLMIPMEPNSNKCLPMHPLSSPPPPPARALAIFV